MDESGVLPAVDAASMLLMRDGAEGPELLIVERSVDLAFGAGAFAFPGGRVDPADREAAADHPALQPDDAALRVAAIRETFEETGIDLTTLLPGLEPMTLFARWCPPGRAKRRFDTRFYLAHAPAGLEPSADGGEIVHAFWARPDDILARCREKRGRALFPTKRLLERLARFDGHDEARDDALALPCDTVVAARFEERTDGVWLCIPEGLGYPITAERREDVARS